MKESILKVNTVYEFQTSDPYAQRLTSILKEYSKFFALTFLRKRNRAKIREETC